jgi:hypothetical protein
MKVIQPVSLYCNSCRFGGGRNPTFYNSARIVMDMLSTRIKAVAELVSLMENMGNKDASVVQSIINW